VNAFQPRHVLHVLNAAVGGAALSTIGLIESLRERGIESSAVCHDLGGPEDREALASATRGKLLLTPLYWWNHKIRVPAWKRPLGEIKQLWRTGWKRRSTSQVVQFSRRHDIDLIHSNTILTLEGGFAARQLGVPHVWHVRELIGPGHPWRFPIEGPAFGRFLQTHAAKVIANSQATAAAIQSWLPPGLLDVVPNGIDVSRFVPRRHEASDRPLVVAMVGNLTSRWKNHLLFARAAALVDPTLPIEWRIYGHDPSHGGQPEQDEYVDQLLAEVRRAGLTDRFRLAGFHADPAEIMGQIDLLVHPAESESFGRIIVEGMAAGLPVVGVAAGGVGEIVRHEETGLLAAPHAADQMAQYITRLARDPDLRNRYGAAGCRRAHDCYSLGACAEGVIRTYQAAMKVAASGGVATIRAASGHPDAEASVIG
jgi:glycosyltransferase involved in cell wall biosynthesis